MQRFVVVVGALIALLAPATPAAAITQGQPDAGRHPQVGALIGNIDGVTRPYCTGVLISATVLLTAAHCDIGVTTVQVTFDEQYSQSSPLVAGDWHANPSFTMSQKDPRDLAVAVFDAPVAAGTPARLPRKGILDRMKSEGTLNRDTLFTSVGYGGRAAEPGPGGQTHPHHNAREFAVGSFSALGKGFLRISQNAAQGRGGTCAGDSGGPNFFGAGADETDVIAGITITGDTYCKATNVTQRLDTTAARAFLDDYVAVP